MIATAEPEVVTAAVPRVVRYEARYLDQVMVLAREMHAESKFHSRIPLNEAKLVTQLEAASASDAAYYFRLCVRGDEVLGGFLGAISSIYFSDEKVAKDLAWFVKRNRRGSLAAVMLVADFETWARAQGAQHFVLGQSTGVHMDTTTALYEHLGYEVVGMNTVKRA